MNISKSAFIAALVIIGQNTLVAAADENKSSEEALKAKAKISRTDAEKLALKEVGSGKIVDSELEKEGGKLIYSFDISQQKGTKEVHVDAISGKVLNLKTESARDEAKERKEEKEEAAKKEAK